MDMRLSGANYNFAPCLAVSRDERWGRTFESYSEDKDIVSKLGEAFVLGQQNSNLPVATSLKRFVGDGSTLNGVDRSNSIISRDELIDTHLYPYIKSIEAGATSVMISQHSWNDTEMHGNKNLITEVLKGELGFKGFVISDWAGIDQLPGNYYQDIIMGINAGLDMIMVPDKFESFYTLTLKAVRENRIDISRIDDAVERILKVKFDLGLFDDPYPVLDKDYNIGNDYAKSVAREAVNKSVVILKNDKVLPIKAKKIVVAGSNANNIGNQCGGWTIRWQGESGNITSGTTIFEGIKEVAPKYSAVILSNLNKDLNDADHIILVIGEKPYAEWEGDNNNIELYNWDKMLLEKAYKTGNKITVVLISGRPMVITDELKKVDSLVAAFLPGTEGGGVADILFGNIKPTGKLAFSWPKSNNEIPVNFDTNENIPLFPIGYGLTY